MKSMGNLKLGLVLGVVLAAVVVQAREPRGLGHWQGKGTTFQVGGPQLGDFKVEVTRTKVSEAVVELKGSVVIEDGRVFTFTQTETQTEHGFRISGDQGNGGGTCFGEGLCQTYVDSGNGRAVATTIVIDGEDKLRLLVTELKDGKAVRIMRESLTRTAR